MSNVQSVVQRLGGEQLYGVQADQFEIVVRELIQNARDALVARSALDPHHDARIWVDVESLDGTTELVVTDNGIGMSERVLTGSMLEFGQSFWSSDLIRSEFPGLVSSKFRPVGKFGIGFYSIFMIAEEATITSKRWSDGYHEARRLRFPNGLTMRPLLELPDASELRSDASTVVRLRLRPDLVPDDRMMTVTRNTVGTEDLRVPLEDFLAAVVVGLDVQVLYQADGGGYGPVHLPQPLENASSQAAWWKQASMADHQPSQDTAALIDRESPRLRALQDNDVCHGVAAISTVQRGVGMTCTPTIGGLAADVHNRSDSPFFGWMDQVPNSAKRDVSNSYAAPAHVLNSWLVEQESLLEADPEPWRRVHASGHFMRFEYVPRKLMTAVVFPAGTAQTRFVNLDQLVNLAEQTSVGVYVAAYGHVEINMNLTGADDAAVILPFGAGHCSAKLEAGIPADPYSLLHLIHLRSIERGLTPVWIMETTTLRSHLTDQPLSFLRLRTAQ